MKIELGKSSTYLDQYTPSLLEAIPRSLSRAQYLHSEIPLRGWDAWTAYELSWLNLQGLPQVTLAEFYIDAASHNIIESKSFKYYLNSLNQTQFASKTDLIKTLQTDLSAVAAGEVLVQLKSLSEVNALSAVPGICLDDLAVAIESYQPKAALLQLSGETVASECLYTNLFKSNCPVTGQPDWATLWVQYTGQEIKRESLLRYLVSYRQHQGFHESCVEKIFYELLHCAKLSDLTVYARYTRRGGLDINPLRSTKVLHATEFPFGRLVRQ